MEYTEEKMIKTFVKRYNNSKDMVTEKRIAENFIKLHGLSIFRFINKLREYDEKICNRFIKTLGVD